VTTQTRWQLLAVALLVGLFSFLTYANSVPKERRIESAWLPDHLLRWGLDLQGGIHWVVGVDIEEAVKRELAHVGDGIARDVEDQNLPKPGIRVEEGVLTIEARSLDHVTQVRAAADDSGVLTFAEADGAELSYTLDDDWVTEVRERTMMQVLEVLRRRIDDPERGIPDSVITRQGDDRVLVQIPGGQIDRSRARDLLKSTGFLEFKIVEAAADGEEKLLAALPSGLPEGKEIAFEYDPEIDDKVVQAYLVPEEADITGDYLDDARVGFDQQQRPIVNFTFNPEGGALFQTLTGEHVGDGLAIILDDRVYSAPVIRSQIGSRGQISGRFTSQEAADLAVVLRAGSLAVPVVIEEERSIGPALGQDSIDRGTFACIVGLVLIIAFVVAYYRLSGGYASVALLTNLVLLVGLMSLFEATLTLPGIAGLVLTVGMAVDANVIIFERIREELAAGKLPRAAAATGFSKALWTVLDANLTTLFTALVLFEFGTGPIKGFAVTLSIGIVTSVFAALVVTRLLFQVYPGNRPVQELSI